MIRHSSSFIASLIFHVLLAFAVFLGYRAILLVKKSESKNEKRVKIQLCSITKTKTIVEPVKTIRKQVSKPKPKPKEIKKYKIIQAKKIIPVKKVNTSTSREADKIQDLDKRKALKSDNHSQQKKVQERKIEDKPKESKKVLKPQESVEEKELRLEKNYINENIQKIAKLLQDNLYYPRSARKRGITGDVVVRFTLSTSAKVHSIEVISSKYEILSRAAIKTIEDLSTKFPQPREELILHVPINYKLKR